MVHCFSTVSDAGQGERQARSGCPFLSATTPQCVEYVRRATDSLQLVTQVRVSGLVEESIVDGPGLRYVIFTQGCPHHCPGCHNPETHDPDGGTLVDVDAVLEQFRENPLLSGITFSGGEPFMQPEPLCLLAKYVASLGKTVMTYTGFTFEQLTIMGRTNQAVAVLLALTDTLIDGPYVEALRDLELSFRGSANQRMLSRDDRMLLLKGWAPGY